MSQAYLIFNRNFTLNKLGPKYATLKYTAMLTTCFVNSMFITM